VDLPVTCVLIKIGQKYPYIEGVYRGVTFRAGFTQFPNLEQLFIDAEMDARTIRTEYNHKMDSYGLDPTFPSDCTIGAFERGYVEKKYGALFAAGYKDHLVDRGMYESPAYRIFLKHQDWRKKFGPSGEGNKENEEKSVSGVKTKSKPFKKTPRRLRMSIATTTTKLLKGQTRKQVATAGLAASKRASEPHLISFWG
jgi:hypothetical protein